ncbi:MAG: lipopolysaccharide transport periplasmic protein LptA [Betaproteobacteria bacterium]|nr:lipopolysaccharide transport periplasmic protein LptA [Betaproteobacteria bacterium]
MINLQGPVQRVLVSTGILLLSLSLLGLSCEVLAETADRDKPIDLEADSVKVDDARQTSTYSGNVILTQGTLVIRADKLIVREDSEGFQHSTSLGNPTTFRQKREGKNEYMEGSAQRIEYDGRMDKVQLYTKAWVKRGEDIVHGEYIMYDANAEYAEVIGGGGSATSSGAQGGRVRAIIQPKNKKAPDNTVPKPTESPAKNNVSSSGATTSSDTATATKNMRFSRSLEVSSQPK